MRDFNALTQYAKEKVESTALPHSLYAKAQRRKNMIDSIMTVACAILLFSLSLSQFSTRATTQSPTVLAFEKQELVAARTR